MIHELLTQALSSVACVGMMAGGALLSVILFALLRSAAQDSADYAARSRAALGFDGKEE